MIAPNARAQTTLPEESSVEKRSGFQQDRGEWVGSGTYRFEYVYRQRGEWPVEALLPSWRRASY